MAIVHEGTSYGVHWTIDDQGLLYIDSGVINCTSGYPMWGWINYSEEIQSVESGNVSWQEGANAIDMFSDCSNLTSLDLSNFDTSNITYMTRMFSGCSKLVSLDLSNFNTSNVTNMDHMFFGCHNLASLNLSNFDTSNVINMSYAFGACNKLAPLDLSSFDTSNVTDMSGMFVGCGNLTSLDVSNFNTGNVTDINGMFIGCGNLTSLDLSNFDTSNVTDISSMFYNCYKLTSLDLSNFDTGNVTDMEYMFHNCNSLTSLDVSNFDTSEVTRMDSMFYRCSSLISLDLSNFDTSEVTRMESMFSGCSNLINILVSNSWVPAASGSQMFTGCSSLSGGKNTSYNSSYVDSTYARIDGGSLAPGYLTDIDETEMYARYDSSNKILVIYRDGLNKYTNNQVIDTVTYMKGIEELTGATQPLWYDYRNSIEQVFILNEFKPLTAYDLFTNFSKLISLDLSKLNTSVATLMNNMFRGCYNLTSLDVSNFDTGNVTDMSYMFGGCSRMASLDLSSFDTSNVTDMTYMFMNCQNLVTLDLSNFNTSNTTSMKGMFVSCIKLTSLDLSSFDTSNVTDMNFMIAYCTKLATLDLSSFDTSNVVNMKEMFENCSKLTCNFYINSIPDDYYNIFTGTVEPIYIIYNVASYTPSDSIAEFWRTIASQYQNVHFEADDHKPYPPQISGSVERVDADDPTKISPEGTKARLTVSVTLNDTFVPQNVVGVAANRLTQSPNITVGVDGDDPITITVGDTVIDLTQQLRLPEDRHIFICIVTDINSSSTIVLELTPIQALLDFLGAGSRDKYIDKPGMGMSIGKLATRNGLDIEFPTTIGKGLLPAIDYNLTTDTEVVNKRDYYEFDSNTGEYILVDPQEGDNPASEGWYDSSVKLDNYQLVVGKYNKCNNNATFIVGNGTDDLNRSNLMEIGDIITIGQTEQSRMEIDYRSMKLIDKEGFAYLDINDLCTPHTSSDKYGEGFYYVNSEEIKVTTLTTTYNLSVDAYHTNYTVSVDNVEVTSGITKYTNRVVFNTYPTIGSVITIEYPTDSGAAKAYTLGRRVPIHKIGISSISEGYSTAAPGAFSHAEGTNTISSGKASHTEGNSTYATGDQSHSEGNVTVASGLSSHAEGFSTTASGTYSHSEGVDSIASGYISHAQNYGTIAGYDYQTAIGKFNDNKSTNAFEIGNGTADNARSNAFEVGWDGRVAATAPFECHHPNSTYGSVNLGFGPGDNPSQGIWSTTYSKWLMRANSNGNVFLDDQPMYIQSRSLSLPSTFAASSVYIRRYGAVVTIVVTNVSKAAVGENLIHTLPAGWRPPATLIQVMANPQGGTPTSGALSLRMTVNSEGKVVVYNYRSTAISSASNQSGYITYIATQ